jgi:hypothetical protein
VQIWRLENGINEKQYRNGGKREREKMKKD